MAGMGTLSVKKPLPPELAAALEEMMAPEQKPAPKAKPAEGLIEVRIHSGGRQFDLTFTASTLRGTIPPSKMTAADLRGLLLPSLARIFGRIT